MRKEDFRKDLGQRLSRTEKQGKRHVDIKSGDLHQSVGGYPGPDHRIPICCDVMYSEMRTGDKLLQAPPKGKGASVMIRYLLPRGTMWQGCP